MTLLRSIIVLLVISVCSPSFAICPIFSGLAAARANAHQRHMNRVAARHKRRMDRKSVRVSRTTVVRIY